MKRLISITTAVVLCSALSFVVVCVAGPPKTITMEGKWSGTTTATPGCADPVGGLGFTAESVGMGVLSHFGLTTWVGDSMCLIALGPAASYPDYAQVFQGYGTATIITAKGEEIYLLTHFTFIGMPGLDFLWAQDIDVANGTGRFENAGGHVHSTGVGKSNSDGTGSWEGTSSGTITY